MVDEKVMEKYLEQYYRISNSIIRFRNIPLSFNGSYPLRTSSIHLIDMIGKKPDMNVTQLAEAFGLTKGAVSQMTSNLEKNGLIKRRKAEGDDKNVYFDLTEEGWKVFHGHEEYHRNLYQKVGNMLDEYSTEELERFSKVIDAIEDAMNEYAGKE